MISDRTVVVFRLCGAWYRYLNLRKNHPTIKLRWWLWRNNGDFFVFVSRFRKMWLTMQNRILRHSLQENWTWKSKGFSKSYQNHKTVQNSSISYPRKIFIFFKSRHVWLWCINSFCSCTTTKILRLKIKRFFPRIISNRYIPKYMTNIYSKKFLHMMNSQGKNNEKISHLFRKKNSKCFLR